MERLRSAPPPVKRPAKKSKKAVAAMRPAEYAAYIGRLAAAGMVRRRPLGRGPFLAGFRIFYADGDVGAASPMTRDRMDYLVRYGATLVPTYDPAHLTHVVTTLDRAQFARKTGLESPRDVPDALPVLRWEWVKTGERAGGLARWHEHAAYNDHVVFEAVVPEGERRTVPEACRRGRSSSVQAKGKAADVEGRPDAGDAEASRISEFTQDRLAGLAAEQKPHASVQKAQRTRGEPSTSAATPHGGGGAADPLAEFYAAARAERETELRSDTPLRTGHAAAAAGSRQTGAFQCDIVPDGKVGTCPNQDVIDELNKLVKVHRQGATREDGFKVGAYTRAINGIRKLKTRIKSSEEALAIAGVGSKTAQKIMEIIETGHLRRLDHVLTKEIAILETFQGIYGVGPKVARQWLAAGCRTLDDIREGKHGVKLSTAQHTGLKYYDDINARMPREEAQAIFELIKPVALSIDPKLFVDIMGSFRRGKADCGDIDILITRPTDDGKSHIGRRLHCKDPRKLTTPLGVLRRLLKELHERGVITEDLNVPEDWDDLELVYRGLCRRDSKGLQRRIDFLTVPYKSRGAALLYYTGDDIFNRSMRLKANKMGYSLNQRGLYANVIRNPSDRRQKFNEGVIIASETEREIFEKLGVPWQEPHQRVRGG
ncbi:hypothetical protein PHLGIDRAFT_480151 [Phlebiopsis gigantea 11061_1 CR5-6]|uniref:DNA polymerase n=1 Tax=Phlebiopsis gigantea (strain 11061_1 CR5-6) TaxID=745531 RepID=A0A0C3S642_PHLG1|nr:hypothetical protein PHLGIDRAFT_480151 [Phlebiopsis gigantea 11061_1 CR5-6]